MSLPSFMSFAQVFASILETRHEDPLLRVLVMTYEFDDLQILNLACAQSLEQEFELRQSLMHTLCHLRPVVIYDARKTRESASLPQFLELHPVHAGPWACHHSKAYLLLTRDTIRLVLGSFNLTGTGLFKNREVFEIMHWDSDHRENLGFLRDWTGFLEAHALEGMGGSSRSALAEIVSILRERTGESLDDAPVTRRLLHSGYEKEHSGLVRLKQAWEHFFPETQPDGLFVVSPFFDLSPRQGSLAADLCRIFPSLRSLELVTSETGCKGLGKDHFGSLAECQLRIVPELIDEAERARLIKLGMGQEQIVKRSLHAKLLCLVSGNKALVYGGSANFTRKAWGTAALCNRELGFVEVCEDFDAWRRTVLECLSVGAADLYSQLPETAHQAAMTDDDEGYADVAGYPDFLGWVQLCRQPDEKLRFVFHAATEIEGGIATLFTNYIVDWRGLSLDVTNGQSQAVTLEQLRERLVGGRNLRIVHRDHPEAVHWFPFQYDDLLVAQRTDFVHPSIWDWFDFNLAPSRGESIGFAEFLPGQDGETTDSPWDAVDRESNPVIRMQTYLSRFEKAEVHFRKLLGSLAECRPEDRQEVFRATVQAPLSSLLHLLVRDAEGGGQKRIEAVFRIGELALFLRQMLGGTESERIALQDLLQEAILFLRTGDEKSVGLEMMYGQFVREAVGKA